MWGYVTCKKDKYQKTMKGMMKVVTPRTKSRIDL